MGNVLAELFQDQANAIREGLGDIGKFPPAEFAERIRDIVALIGTGGGSSGGTGGGESGGTGGGAGTGLKVTSGTFTVPDYDVDISISTSAFASSDRYPGLYVYEVSPAILPLAAGDAYYFQLGGQFWNPATGAKIFDALGQYAACYATGNVNLIEPDYSGNSLDTLHPYLCIYIEKEDKNVIFTSVKANGMSVHFLKMDSLSGTKTIVHGMDQMPDFICVQHNRLDQALTKGAPINSFLSAWAVKSDFADYFGEVLGAVAYSEGGTEIKYGLDDAANNVNARIRCRNDTTFMVGGTVKWYPKASYYWVAISGLGSSGGGDVVIEGVDPYYEELCELLVYRVHEGTLDLRQIQTSIPNIQNIGKYGLAGLDKVTELLLSGIYMLQPHALEGDKSLKIIDITTTTLVTGVGFQVGSLLGCDALESIIVRDGGAGLQTVVFNKTTAGYPGTEGVGDNGKFYVYVPASSYDTIVTNATSNSNNELPADRYRKLEDYPDIDFWNEKYTVNFYDGDTLLHSVQVRYGKNASYTPPSKEGYTFGGWDVSPTNVKQNLNCYAQWLKSYTVNFYDGETLLNTVIVGEGESASYTYNKSGYNFFGWVPSPTDVMEDMDCYGDWQKPFSSADWEDIEKISVSGKASTYYKVGDSKNISIALPTGTISMRLIIAGFDHDNLADGSGKAGISIVCGQAITTIPSKGSSDDNFEVWGTMYLRSYMNSTVLNALPSALRSLIKTVTKVSNKGYNDNSLYTTQDKLWLLSSTELRLDGSSSYVSDNQGEPYELFKTNADRIRKTTANGNCTWFLRSMWIQYTACLAQIKTDGTLYYKGYSTSTGSSYGIVFGFCI